MAAGEVVTVSSVTTDGVSAAVVLESTNLHVIAPTVRDAPLGSVVVSVPGHMVSPGGVFTLPVKES